uniref:Par3/HAL N-terminal domain-containing protein n=1 Tax=Chromera velia CCMP2878 TaxID=1169474 RepID=A0A0G4GV85_9ALVE|eukprot:Cvel_23524.t1-p1 / transcript=Cvel_23524.t1 / gene=Cvel_23524 / organism=Chromera_velia_CCMP2878 / gene_product=hypothetical protein / transcript_product=hypothetical protein / location=Cvel_scaffold2434:1670-3711(+) / protein_length=91 / sequence_SO=supercontig / SO=protein_coding / is_pseudo=false
MKVRVHVKERTFTVQCGPGSQRLRWLAHVAMARYDEKHHGMSLGQPLGVRLETGERPGMEESVASALEDGDDVWVLLREDFMNVEDEAAEW